jgi:hypothetical protein
VVPAFLSVATSPPTPTFPQAAPPTSRPSGMNS